MELTKLMAIKEFREWAEDPLTDPDVRWDTHCQALAEYCKEHEKLPTAKYVTTDERKLNLGIWMNRQKVRYLNSNLVSNFDILLYTCHWQLTYHSFCFQKSNHLGTSQGSNWSTTAWRSAAEQTESNQRIPCMVGRSIIKYGGTMECTLSSICCVLSRASRNATLEICHPDWAKVESGSMGR